MGIMNRFKIKMILLSAMLVFTVPEAAMAETDSQVAMPNIHGKSMITPDGWGAAYGTVFGGIGGTSPAPYSDNSDGATGVGVGIGNPVKNLGIQATAILLDMSDWKRFAINLKFHRYLGYGNSIALGINNIIIEDAAFPSDSEPCYYLVYSQAVQNDHFINEETGRSKLHFSVGVAQGRFLEITSIGSPTQDKYGRRIFGNVSYELFNECNAFTEWDCVGLNAGLSKTFMIGKQSAIVASVGAADLTTRGDDNIRFIWSLGAGVML
jgi:hypothetical protein